jgi:hypothetical protein
MFNVQHSFPLFPHNPILPFHGPALQGIVRAG